MTNSSKLNVTLLKSMIGRTKNQIKCVKGLGLRKRHHTVVVENTPENRGMINKINFMVIVEEMSNES